MLFGDFMGKRAEGRKEVGGYLFTFPRTELTDVFGHPAIRELGSWLVSIGSEYF